MFTVRLYHVHNEVAAVLVVPPAAAAATTALVAHLARLCLSGDLFAPDELVQDLFLDGRVSGFSPVQITPTVNTNRISCM